MELEKIKEVLRDLLAPFNKKKIEVNDEETSFNQILSGKDGYGPANSKNAFMVGARWALINDAKSKEDKKKAKKPWPANWGTLTIQSLAEKLVIFLLFMLLSFQASAQKLELGVGTNVTELRKGAITIVVKYIQSFDSIWRNQDIFHAGRSSAFMLQPEIDIETGTEDAFSSINAKAVGLLMTFRKTRTQGGVEIPDFSKTFHIFPISVGVESNNLFNNVNGILEAGWVPWYQTVTNSAPEFLKSTKFGFFVQAGYKFSKSDTNQIGGKADESLEIDNRGLFRLKGNFSVDLATIKVGAYNIGLLGTADAWYDIINSAVYHRLDGRLRFYLASDNHLDFIYQKGSGAPNFNQGDQYGVGLIVTF